MTAIPLPASYHKRHSIWRLRYLRHAVLAAAIAALAAILTIAAFRLETQAALPVTVDVISTRDPSGIGATTEATVALRNEGGAEIRPRFSVTWLPYPYYWRIKSGPAILRPGEMATYVIESTDATSAPPAGTSFTFRVNDANGIAYAISAPLSADDAHGTIRNADFKFWSIDPGTGKYAPAGWVRYDINGPGDETRIEESQREGVPAAYLQVVQDGRDDAGGWSHTGITQEIQFPTRPFGVKVLSGAPFSAQPGGWPLTAFGLEVSDPENGLIWILFQQTGYGDVEYDLPSGHHIKVFDVPQGQWVTRLIDLPGMYRALNWAAAERVTIKVFIAASSARPAAIDGYVASLSADPSMGGGP